MAVLKAVVAVIVLFSIINGVLTEFNDTETEDSAVVSELAHQKQSCHRFLTSQCINYLYVMAFTSDTEDAAAIGGHSLDHFIKLQAKGLNSEVLYLLPDLPEGTYQQHKGDLWKLSMKDIIGFTTCITVYDIQNISIVAGSNDGWNIETIVTFAVVNSTNWMQISADYNVYKWVDLNSGQQQREFTLSLTITTPPCIRYLYVMAYTSDEQYSGSDQNQRIEIRANGMTKTEVLPDLPEDEFYPSKGDLWELSISNYFGFPSCITRNDIEAIAILAGSNDGWNIDSIVTYIASSKDDWELATVDLDVDRWIDQNSETSYKRFNLTLVI